MADIFREIEEEIQRERYARIWKAYGDYIVAAIAIVIIAIAGWKLWQHHEGNQRLKASDAFIAAEQIADHSQRAEAFAKLATSAPGGYAAVARLQEADSLLAAGKETNAVALYKQIMNGDNPLIADVARMRAGWAQADTASKSELTILLAPLIDAASPWHFTARELLAYSDYHAGNSKAALAEYQALSSDPATPEGIRARAKAMAEFMLSGGDHNVGTVPPPQNASLVPAQNAAPAPGNAPAAQKAPVAQKIPAAKKAPAKHAPPATRKHATHK